MSARSTPSCLLNTPPCWHLDAFTCVCFHWHDVTYFLRLSTSSCDFPSLVFIARWLTRLIFNFRDAFVRLCPRGELPKVAEEPSSLTRQTIGRIPPSAQSWCKWMEQRAQAALWISKCSNVNKPVFPFDFQVSFAHLPHPHTKPRTSTHFIPQWRDATLCQCT